MSPKVLTPDQVEQFIEEGYTILREAFPRKIAIEVRKFIIERDGTEIGKVPATPKGSFGRALFQRMSYHDTPEAPVPEMKFLDKEAKAGEKHEYRVISINSVGLKSEAGK